VGPNGECGLKTKDLDEPSHIMEVDVVNVFKPQSYSSDYGGLRYDYAVYTPELSNFLVPLEIIYRNGLPEGSSVFKRLAAGDLQPEDLGLDHYPLPGEELKAPVFDLSTKLEKGDRYITWLEAKEIASLSDDEEKKIKDVLLKVDTLITKVSLKAKLKNEDGKIELAFDSARQPMVVDVIGTLDECRFTYEGLHVSKEIARQFYKKTKWYKDIEEAKEEARKKGVEDWKTLCKSQPERLVPDLKNIIRNMYTSTANEFMGSKIFDSPKLADVMKQYKTFIESNDDTDTGMKLPKELQDLV
jgi:phosphoribosylaminoimidazole-succinocarboxamide synthase